MTTRPGPPQDAAQGAADGADLPTDLLAALERLSRVPEVLVASDFDGVLAPFVHDPMTSRALPGTLEDLTALADLPRSHTAVVSGRDLDVLATLTSLPPDSRVTLIGSHGAQSSRATDDGLTDDQAGALERLTGDLHAMVEDHPGARLELKPTATVLHTRGQEAGPADAAVSDALEVAARHSGVTVLRGKDVVEMSVVTADKGTALMALRDEVGAGAVAYFGDDVTDEHAFEVMGPADVSVKVGEGRSAARHRLDRPEDVAVALRTLLALRRAALA